MSNMNQAGFLRDDNGALVITIGGASGSGILPVSLQGLSPVEEVNRKNSDITLIPSGVYSAGSPPAVPVPDDNLYARGVRLSLDITAAPNTTDSLQIVLEHNDPTGNAGVAPGRWLPIVTFAAVVGSAVQGGKTKLYTLYPATLTAATDHEVATQSLARGWRARALFPVGTGNWTFSLGGALLL